MLVLYVRRKFSQSDERKIIHILLLLYIYPVQEKREVCIVYLDFEICRTSYQVFIGFSIGKYNHHVAAGFVAVLTLVLGTRKYAGKKTVACR